MRVWRRWRGCDLVEVRWGVVVEQMNHCQPSATKKTKSIHCCRKIKSIINFIIIRGSHYHNGFFTNT